MSALISWVLLLGGVAATIVAASLGTAVEPDAQVVIALGGLLAVVVGAVGLMLARVAGDAPRELRPPGASGRARRPGRRGRR